MPSPAPHPGTSSPVSRPRPPRPRPLVSGLSSPAPRPRPPSLRHLAPGPLVSGTSPPAPFTPQPIRARRTAAVPADAQLQHYLHLSEELSGWFINSAPHSLLHIVTSENCVGSHFLESAETQSLFRQRCGREASAILPQLYFKYP